MNIYEYYNEILKEHEQDYAFLTRLEIADNLNGMSMAEDLTSEEKSFLISAISEYWLDNDLQENSLFDITWQAVTNHMEKLDYKAFNEKMDELV